jgi:ferredoxin/nitrate reductase assembly molybdenum cofactor insertion protein NarJ
MVEIPQQAQDKAALAEAARSRAMIYHALAEALAGPVPGIERLLLDAVTAGSQVLGSAACQRSARALAELPERGFEDLRDGYMRTIACPRGRPVALYESLHRQGSLMGQITGDVERHYRALGLAPVDGELPDHASVELAFLGHLAVAEMEARAAKDGRLVARLRAEQRYFLHTHAGAWLPDVGDALAATEDLFYAAVGHVLRGFLSEELVNWKRNSQPGAELLTLKDPAGCTLCGLCVGSCLRGALQVMESITETALALKMTQCIGCGRCVRKCPEGVLVLSFGAANMTGWQVIRQSPRIGCPGCGRPTVSQAELDAVFAKLQTDPSVQQRLSLCVECKSWSS